LIKINLVREGRAVRGAGAAPAAAAMPGAAAPSTLNNLLIIGGIILGALVAGGWWWYKNGQLNERKELVATKQAEADRLQKIIKQVQDFQKQKDSLQRRINLINELKQNQKGPVRVMDQVSRDLPDLVWLDRMSITGNAISMNGRGLNPNAIANFVDNIKHDPLFEEPDLGAVTQVSAVPAVYAFDMSFHFTTAPKTAPGTAGAATGTSGTTGSTGTSATTATTATTSGKK